MNIHDFINNILEPYNVIVNFSEKAIDDLDSYNKDLKERIVALVIRRGIKGPLIKPNGLGEPLHGKLRGFTKIKPKKLGIRIIYRPLNNGYILMQVIAIGPRDRKKVYKMAATRINGFNSEMASNE
ncbi:hypothetical protein [Bacillus sp. E(2018)]|uniref:hypothetical protein n=1 Tax=Bacillus sp. E(2018) TaxID=2502239 RepID=UPI0010F66AEE|nr:hypothetical protein [Bacillus sp. E(2018)]